MSSQPARVPTVNDLRVKLCYICREEERYDAETGDPPRPWTHPCNCTLIAHESCLLQWIQTAQSNTQRAPNALKCPQCGTEYELESEKSVFLDIMSAGNRVLQKVGGAFMLVSVAGIAGVMGSGIYIMLTAYGAWAVEQYIGKEMFDMLLTNDPSNWPWTAFINLPLLPISLITSRLSTSPTLPTLLPILLVWPPSPVAHQWMHHEPWHKRDRPYPPRLRTWPPSPVIFGLFIAPLVRLAYRKALSKVSHWLLGASLSESRRRGRLGLQFNEGPFMIRIRANVQEEDVDGEHDEERNEEPQQQRHEGDAGAGAVGNANVNGVNAQGEGQGNANPNGGNNANQDPNAANLAAAEQLIEINTTSLGRRVGGALLIPWISNIMGSILFRLSKHSHILREFLGIKQHRRLLNGLPPSMYAYPTDGKDSKDGTLGWKNLGYVARIVFGNIWGGSRTWAELDPVWWRNSVGLGLFVVAKDCLHLAHLWLAKRELETRRVKNRDFSGVDIKELDLIPSFFRSTQP